MNAYEPGTVAVATVKGVKGVRVVRGEGLFADKWYANRPVAGSDTSFYDAVVTDVRPLVVLDIEQAYGCWAEKRDPALIVARLRNTRSVAALAIADQIEEQTRPSKPEEPTGLGAVVEDEDGSVLVRLGDSDHPWQVVEGGSRWHWDAIDVARVVSEGVTL
jgi:hypothetical protein